MFIDFIVYSTGCLGEVIKDSQPRVGLRLMGHYHSFNDLDFICMEQDYFGFRDEKAQVFLPIVAVRNFFSHLSHSSSYFVYSDFTLGVIFDCNNGVDKRWFVSKNMIDCSHVTYDVLISGKIRQAVYVVGNNRWGSG